MSTTAARRHDLRQLRYFGQVWWLGYLVVVGGGLVIAAVARHRVTEPFLGLSLAVMVLLLVGWVIHPRATLYSVLFLTAVSDQVTVWWFPFVKNFSSRESISYVSDSLTISPVDVALVLGAAVTTLRRYGSTRTILPRTSLTWPLIAFTAFVGFGFVRGVASGGDLRVAVLEGRPLFYILLVFVIVVNECTSAAHLRYALWAILAGVVVQSLLSIQYLEKLSPAQRDALESLNEHGSTLGHNLLIVTLLALVALRMRHRGLKWALVTGAAPTVFVVFVAQRRAGIAALIVGIALLAITLFWRRRRTFWMLIPALTIALAGYVGAFWNSTSSLGFPAQAVKAIVAPNSVSAEDKSSDLYRQVEAYDLNFTIRANPVLGRGFGQPFYRPVALPDISVFALNAYMPHNSLLWIWIKLGFGGFAAMFYLFAKAVMSGAERVRRMPFSVDLVVAFTAVAYVAMYLVYTFVDVSWDARNTVFLGLALAICTHQVPRRSNLPRTELAVGDHADSNEATMAVERV